MRRIRQRGMTLVELIVAFTILMLLSTMAVPLARYKVQRDSDNYPETLEQLVEGVKAMGAVDKKIKYLRRIPKDPMTNSKEWGIRSTRDDPKALAWGGQNVFDIYTKSSDKAHDGTPYSEW
jgi:general secretion pathway protein G